MPWHGTYLSSQPSSCVATKHHGPQLGKGSRIPYVSHLLGVTSLVLEAGGDETEP